MTAALPASEATQVRQRIVILGDSITSGHGMDPSDSYPALLQDLLTKEGYAYEVVNAGIGGDTTAGGLARIDWALSKGAAILVVALGGNDGLRGVDPVVTEKNLRAIVTKARQKIPGLPILLAGMHMPESMGRDYSERFHAVFEKVATSENTARMPFLLEGVAGDPSLNLPDLIHPNEAGQKIIAAGVLKALEPLLWK